MRGKGRTIALVVLAAALLLAGCSSRGVINPGWTVVSVADGRVYTVLATGKVVALDGTSGSEIWNYPIVTASSGGLGGLFSRQDANQDTVLNAVYGVPVFSDDLMLVGTFDNKLVAFNRNSGQKAWEYTVEGAIIGGAAVYDGIVYFGASDSRVYAVKPAASGAELLWNPVITGHGVWGSPAVNDKLVFVASLDHHVYALDRATGALVWDHSMGAAIPGGVTLADGLLLVGGVAKKLSALNTATGEMVWEQQFEQWVWGEAAVTSDTAYVSTLDGKVHALNLSDGTIKWTTPLEGALRAGPTLAGEYLVIGTQSGRIYRVELASGKADLLYVLDKTNILAPVAVQDGIAYVGTTAASIIALDINKVGGSPLWTFPVAK